MSAYSVDRRVNADLHIRMAIELELNQPPPPHLEGREALNRTRTWLNCYCVDGSHAIQFGKLPMLRLDDYIARNSRNWYKTSSLNSPYDVHLCGYVQMIIHMAKWREYMKEDITRSERQVSRPGSSLRPVHSCFLRSLVRSLPQQFKHKTF